MEASSTSTTLVQLWRISVDSPTTTLGWLRIRDVIQPGCAYLLPTTTFIGDECFQAGENDGVNKRFRFDTFEIFIK